MIGLYFSGTGNTAHCVEEWAKAYDQNSEVMTIEHPDVRQKIAAHDFIVFGYPIYYSNLPKIVFDFIDENKSLFHNKKILIIATMALFSGDGTGCAARLFKKYGAEIVGGLHLKMPDNIGDEKLLKKSPAKNKEMYAAANEKIHQSVQKTKAGRPDKDGLSVFCHFAGLFGQRLWFYGQTKNYKSLPNINREKCNGCGRCAKDCPMKNIKIVHDKAKANDRCTLCYRCFSGCPAQALTILGKRVHAQYRYHTLV